MDRGTEKMYPERLWVHIITESVKTTVMGVDLYLDLKDTGKKSGRGRKGVLVVGRRSEEGLHWPLYLPHLGVNC